ncbi:MAG: glycosyltransferase family 4 protein [Erysipelotrichaceae bacterium]|nr:glycosyltransferase family 4 protein [Erysipelotrichaceae bacterium]
MKVLLYFEKQKSLKQSGIGRALTHQKKALELANVDYTLYKDEGFDLAHINTLFFDSYKLLKKCKKNKKLAIVHGHSTVEDFRYSFRCWRLIAPIFNRMILRMYRKADLIITPTNYSKSLIENYKRVKCPVYAVSNGIKLEDYQYNEEYVNEFKKFFNFGNKKIVISAGLYFKRKGIFDFFEVARQMPDVEFIWFGHLDKILAQGKVLRAIKKRPKNVSMPGYVDIRVLKGAFLSADAFFFPSFEENEGIAVLEAMASKTPVLVRDIGVFKDWLTDGVNCYKATDVQSFKDKLEFILNNDVTNVVNNGYMTVEERTLDKVGNKLKEIYINSYNEKKQGN